MVEYRVKALYYRFVSDLENDRFDEASPLTARRGDFDCSLVDGLLTAVPIVELKDRETAREALEPHLRDWEQDAYLSPRAFSFHFQYERSDIEALDPDPGNVYVFPEAAVGRGTAFGAAAVIRRNSEYPPPYPTYRRTPVTENLVARLRRTRDGREPWPAFANFVLTQLEADFGGRKGAAAGLVISRVVLDKLGRICAKRDPDIGRKAGRTPETISPAEGAWLEAVVVRLIRRVGEHASGGTLTQVTMADFPPLP